jgi:hypothetical protein
MARTGVAQLLSRDTDNRFPGEFVIAFIGQGIKVGTFGIDWLGVSAIKSASNTKHIRRMDIVLQLRFLLAQLMLYVLQFQTSLPLKFPVHLYIRQYG